MEVSKWMGGAPPLGYTRHAEKKVLIVNSLEAKIVHEIYNYALSGLSAGEIAKKLNRVKLYSSRRANSWTYKTISYFFNPNRIDFYAGFKDELPGNWEAIISAKMAEKLKSLQVVVPAKPRPRKNKYLLPGLNIAKCGYCGGTVKSISTKRKDEFHRYYYCTNRIVYGKDKCPESKMIVQEKIDPLIISDIAVKKSCISKIEIYTRELEKKLTDLHLKQISELDHKIKQQISAQQEAKTSKQLNLINVEVLELMNRKNELLLKSIYDFDFSELDPETLNNIYQLSIDNKRKLVQNYVKRILLFNDYLIIHYPFAINSALETQTKIEY